MGKTRDLFKKIRDTKGTFHKKMGTVKDRNSMDLTETEDVKKRWHDPSPGGRRIKGQTASFSDWLLISEPPLQCHFWVLGVFRTSAFRTQG